MFRTSYFNTYQYRNVFLGFKSLDFYLPKYNIAIECQGLQHFMPVSFGGEDKEKNYQYTIANDLNKYNECKENDIDLIYFIHDVKGMDKKKILKECNPNGIYTEENLFDNPKTIIKYITTKKREVIAHA